MKKIMLFFLLICMASVFALTDGCGNEVDVNTACVIRTPPITCSTYDLFNSTNELNIDDGTMSEVITGSGVYNFTFNQVDLGIHTIILCDNTSSSINVEVTDETDLATILASVLSVNRTKASVENISTILDNITNAQSGIVSKGDTAWITATGFETESDASSRFSSLSSGIQNNATNTTNSITANITASTGNIISVGDSNWITAVGFSTHSAADIWTSATRTLTSFGTLISDIWSAGTRTLTVADWQTETDASTRFSSLSDGIQNNATAVSANVTAEVDDISPTITESDKEDIADKVLRRPVTDSGKSLNVTLQLIEVINETTYYIEQLI